MWQQPVLRSAEPGHRQATWIELFFDLIFVVAAAQLATFLVEDVTWWRVTVYSVVYLAVWLSWITATFYANRFDSDDLSQRLITFAQMLTVAGMAASVAEEAAIQFAISIAVFRLLMAVSYWRVRGAIPGDAGSPIAWSASCRSPPRSGSRRRSSMESPGSRSGPSPWASRWGLPCFARRGSEGPLFPSR